MLRFIKSVIIAATATFAPVTVLAQETVVHPPIEAYGNLPKYSSASVSPKGDKFATILQHEDGEELGVIMNYEEALSLIRTTEVKSRGIDFITDDYAVIYASDTKGIFGFRGKLEYSAAFTFDIKKEKLNQLLRKADTLYPAQGGLGEIVGIDRKKNRVLMPAWSGDRYIDPTYDLYSVRLSSGAGRIKESGRHYTRDWLVDAEGNPLIRVDFNHEKDDYQIFSKKTGKWKVIYEEETELLPFTIEGIKPDYSALIINITWSKKGDTLHEMDFEGNISKPIFWKENTDIDGVITDINRRVFGVRYSGVVASYEFFDPRIDSAVNELTKKLSGLNLSLESWSDDFSKMVFNVSGGVEAGSYYVFDTSTQQMSLFAQSREIGPEAVGTIMDIKYKARDEMLIPAIVTLPPGVETPSNLPTIIMPHGGPQSYDQVTFDWMAQYFANRGYMILQPNFRGSTGFGYKYMTAGFGEWGGLMQDDVTDGVNAMIKMGWADPDRICIAGASYGGYAALAGGAYTPDLYKCIIAISPISDLKLHLDDIGRESGRDSFGYETLERTIGDTKDDKDKLRDRSPAYHADTFEAPVLLIHGKDDTVVRINQSRRMEDKLSDIGKQVELLQIKGEDHWMSTSETRLETLKAMDTFLKKYNPVSVSE